MATLTPNLNLKKPAGTDYVRVSDFNENANVLDASIGDLGQLTTDAKASLVLAINEAAQRGGENAPFIDVDTLHWMMWDFGTAQYVDSGVKAEGADGSDGADGISAFVWIKWSAIQPTQNSDMKDAPDQFIGVYSGTSPTAPTAYTSYQWYKYKGDKGDVGNPGTGNNWYVGTAISGTSLTPAVYPTGIPNALIGDMYLNNGELPDTGRAYVCTLGGNAATALWKYSCLLRGADGNGTGDMLKSVYDTDNDGVVDNTEKLGGNLPAWYQQSTNGLTAETAMVDADTLPFYDASAAANRKTTWGNIKTLLSALFAPLSHASQHATGGADAITPAAIGADPSGTASTAVSDHNSAAGAHSALFAAKQNTLTPGTDYAIPAVDITATLSATWTGSAAPYTQSISISGMTAAKKIQVGLAASCTAAQYAVAEKAKLLCTAQSDGAITVTAFGTKPTIALPIIVRVVS